VKIPENPGKNGAQRCLTSKNGAQRLQKNTIKTFFGVTPKTGVHVLCGGNLSAKGARKRFGQVLGNSGKNHSHPKALPAPTPKTLVVFQCPCRTPCHLTYTG